MSTKRGKEINNWENTLLPVKTTVSSTNQKRRNNHNKVGRDVTGVNRDFEEFREDR